MLTWIIESISQRNLKKKDLKENKKTKNIKSLLIVTHSEWWWYVRCKCCFFSLCASWSYLKCIQTIKKWLAISRLTTPPRKILVIIKTLKNSRLIISTILINHVLTNWSSFYRKNQVNDLLGLSTTSCSYIQKCKYDS